MAGQSALPGKAILKTNVIIWLDQSADIIKKLLFGQTNSLDGMTNLLEKYNGLTNRRNGKMGQNRDY